MSFSELSKGGSIHLKIKLSRIFGTVLVRYTTVRFWRGTVRYCYGAIQYGTVLARYDSAK